MRGIAAVPSYVVMQPTTLCNLDCAYCYLPFRGGGPPDAGGGGARRWPATVNDWAGAAARFSVVWHGGEPLAAGREHLAALMAPFARRRAPRPDQRHADRRRLVRVLRRARGPGQRERRRSAGAATRDRVDSGRPPGVRPDHARASTRCAGTASPFAALCVVGRPGARPRHRAVRRTSSTSAATCSASTSRSRRASTPRSNALRRRRGARRSGRSCRRPGARDPRIHLREIEWSLRYAAAVLDGTADDAAAAPARPDPDHRARRLGGAALARAGRLHRSAGTATSAVGQRAGDRRWPRSSPAPAGTPAGSPSSSPAWRPAGRRCPYFGFCGGAHAANRYFEHGRFDGTETRPLPQQQDPPTGGSARPCPRPRADGGLTASRRTPRGRAGARRAGPALSALLAEADAGPAAAGGGDRRRTAVARSAPGTTSRTSRRSTTGTTGPR